MANSVFYSNTAVQTTLSGNINGSQTTIGVASVAGFPVTYPYDLALDYGGASEELVRVTNAAGTSLTVTRAWSGTSGQSHSTGAAVVHVFHAGDATDFRTHEAATAAVHGVAGTLVGTSDTQTLANKTLTAPTINAGALSGTFSGSPTLSGNPAFSGTPAFTAATFSGSAALNGGGVLSGTFSGSPTLSGAVTASGGLTSSSTTALSGGGSLAGTFSGTPTLSGALSLTGNPIIQQASIAEALRVRVGAAATPHLSVRSDGRLNWSDGTASTDTNLYRASASLLKTDHSLEVTGSATVTGNVTVSGNISVAGIGQTLFVRKTSDTSKSSDTTLANDPHLTLAVAANATYIVEGLIVYRAHSNGDLLVDWTVPAGATGYWTAHTPGSGTTTETLLGYSIRTKAMEIADSYTMYGTDEVDSRHGAVLRGLLRTSGTAGNYTLQWAQGASSGAATIIYTDSFLLLRRVA